MSKPQSPTFKCLEASQEIAFANYQLTVHGFLHGLRKSLSPPCQPGKIAPISKLQLTSSTCHEDLLFVDSVAAVSGPGILDPPESTSSEIDSDRVVNPIPEARRLQSAVPEGADGCDVLRTMPKVVRTYTRKITREFPVREDSPTSSLRRSFVHERALLNGPLDDASNTSIKQFASKKDRRIKDTKKRTSAVPRKRRQKIVQDDEEACQEDCSGDGADTVIRKDNKTKRKKRKKRRAPVNQLALVARAPSHEDYRLNFQVRTSLWHFHLLWVLIKLCA